MDYEVVWSGRDPLLPPRDEKWDSRFASMPSFDLDDGEGDVAKPTRIYNRTGRHVGKFSRDEAAKQARRVRERVKRCRHKWYYVGAGARGLMRCERCDSCQGRDGVIFKKIDGGIKGG